MKTFIGYYNNDIVDERRYQSKLCWHVMGKDLDDVKAKVKHLHEQNPDMVVCCHRSATTFLSREQDYEGHPMKYAAHIPSSGASTAFGVKPLRSDSGTSQIKKRYMKIIVQLSRAI